MIDIYSSDSQPNPLDDIIIDYLLGQKNEGPWLDFKYEINIQKGEDFPEIAKDLFAMSNYGGGYLIAGVKETPTGTFEFIGLPKGFHIDQAVIQEKFNSYSSTKIQIFYTEPEREVDGEVRKFPVIYAPPSKCFLVPSKDGEYKKGTKNRIVFTIGQLLSDVELKVFPQQVKRLVEYRKEYLIKF